MKSDHRDRKPEERRRRRRTWILYGTGGLLVYAAILSAVLYGARKWMLTAATFNPAPLEKQPKEAQATVIYAGDGSVYMRIPPVGGPNQVKYQHIPKDLQNAVVAIEDHTFWTRKGLDIRGIARATWHDLLTNSRSEGASTIEEQLAKMVYLTDDKTFKYKIKEIIYGLQIDRDFTKQEILTQYLNRVFLGENCVGVEQAAERYFGVNLAKGQTLSLTQAALLAGLPQAPSEYDPIRHPKEALARRNQVLEAMAKYGYISEAQARTAQKAPLGVKYHSLSDNVWDKNPLFTNFLLDSYANLGFSRQTLFQGGLKIYTTIQPSVQKAVNAVFWGTKYNSAFPAPVAGKPVDAAAIFVDPKTGGVLGAAGSRKSDYSPDGFDRVYAYSQPGSSIKPVLEYGAAIQSGKFTPASILDNTPHDFGGGYVPQNDSAAPDWVTLQYALVNSENVASVWLLQQIGMNAGIQFAQRDGISFTAGDKQHLSIAIGGMEKGVTPWEMAQAYEAFDDHGVQNKEHLITRIVNANGKTIYRFKPVSKTVMSAQTASTMTRLMMDVVKDGTGQDAQIPGWDTAGKTGTVQFDEGLSGAHPNWISRAWWDGYTPNIVGSIYIGYDDPRSTTYHLNWNSEPNHYCELIFRDVLEMALRGEKPQSFQLLPDTTGTVSSPPSSPKLPAIPPVSPQGGPHGSKAGANGPGSQNPPVPWNGPWFGHGGAGWGRGRHGR
ncbi:transglycosylase domain-containing protein [Alicyclobacillus acidiphilus]|uniref:transglycosylase domain-containing protein n=1 Tax=Alicyclobacillus acidiphilus TaxID=182455 RepID=UPI00082AF301|nr:transglycosylase domain-containing protein [Alicyclobacillus acidiphilus]